MTKFYKDMVSIYGKERPYMFMGGSGFLFYSWVLLVALAGLAAALIGPELNPGGHVAMWVIFISGLATLVLGFYHSLFYNILLTLSAFIATLITVIGWIIGDVQTTLGSVILFATLSGLYAFVGTFMVFNILIDRKPVASENR